MPTPNAVPPLHGYLPMQPARTYRPVGYCIYCGSTRQLSDEHIIPLGLGGRLVLPQSTCSSCSAKTSKSERTCLRTMYGPLRLLYGLPSRRKNSRPETLQLKIKRTEGSEWEYVPVVQERYPFLITFPYFEAPGALTGTEESAAAGPVTRRLWIRGASPHHDFQELLQSLAQELRRTRTGDANGVRLWGLGLTAPDNLVECAAWPGRCVWNQKTEYIMC